METRKGTTELEALLTLNTYGPGPNAEKVDISVGTRDRPGQRQVGEGDGKIELKGWQSGGIEGSGSKTEHRDVDTSPGSRDSAQG